MSRFNTVNIRPGVNILSVLPHLNYKAWYALAEFVDNAIQSSLSRRKDLEAVSGSNYMLRVDINFYAEENRITIYDNAAGIATSEFPRAFRPAEIPPDATGLSEFGMGMKSAACWFSPKWRVRSSALGENLERTIFFDIDHIVHDNIEELDIVPSVVSEDKHYTEVSLTDIRRFPKGRTISKIKDHLASIYRIFFRTGKMDLFLDGERLTYKDPKILVAPSYKNPKGQQIEWKKDIKIDLGQNKSAAGFIAIRETGSTKLAGIALFRRNRLVLGSVDETYRPQDIFGHPNTFAYQRVFGEIHLKGFNVTHTKDGVKWEESEDDFLSNLHQILRANDMPILQQAQEYRTRKDAHNARQSASQAGHSVAEHFGQKILLGDTLGPFEGNDNSDIEVELEPVKDSEREVSQFKCVFRGAEWVVSVELSFVDRGDDWLCIHSRPSIMDPEPREVMIRIAMLHPFMVQFSNLGHEGFRAILSIAAAVALSEVIAAENGLHNPWAVRSYSNEILKNLMSR